MLKRLTIITITLLTALALTACGTPEGGHTEAEGRLITDLAGPRGERAGDGGEHSRPRERPAHGRVPGPWRYGRGLFRHEQRGHKPAHGLRLCHAGRLGG